MSQRFDDHFAQIVLLPLVEWRGGNKVDLDLAAAGLDELELQDRRDAGKAQIAAERPAPRPVRHDDQVALAAEDAPERRQAAPASGLPAHLRIVADLVADDRRGEVGEIGDEDPANLTGLAGLSGRVDDLDDQRFRHHVILAAIRALDCDDPRLLRRITVLDLEPEERPDPVAQLRRHRLRDGADMPQLRPWPAALGQRIHQEAQIVGIGEEGTRPEGAEFCRLLVRRNADRQPEARPGAKQQVRRWPPIIQPRHRGDIGTDGG